LTSASHWQIRQQVSTAPSTGSEHFRRPWWYDQIEYDVESALAPTWDEIGRLGAIALIRTFLNYFLQRDMAELEEREVESESAGEIR
jgi:Protein of unknown function (DUF1622)